MYKTKIEENNAMQMEKFPAKNVGVGVLDDPRSEGMLNKKAGITPVSQTGTCLRKAKTVPLASGIRGITLVTLVITVIVLLILAGATVTVALSGDGIFSKANRSVTEWNTKVGQEEDALNANMATLNEYFRVTSDQKVVVTSDPVKGSYTNENVSVIIKYGENDDQVPMDYVIQYKEKANETAEESEWKAYTGPVTVETLGKQIKGRLYNATLNHGTAESEWFIVDNIDRANPSAPTAIAKTGQTATSMTVEANGGNDDSGSWKYQYKIGNGETWLPQEGTTEGYELTGLTAGQTYTVKARSIDNAGKTSNEFSSQIQLEIHATALSISGTATVAPGSATQLTVSKTPANTTNRVEWSISPESESGIATVNSTTGEVTGVSAGTVTIIATAKDNSGNETATASYEVIVAQATAGLTVTLANGSTETLTAENFGSYLGKVVTNYTGAATTVNSKTVSNTYRLYWIDFENKYGDGEGTVYLKADVPSSGTYVLSQETTQTVDAEDSVIRKLNPGLYKDPDTGASRTPPGVNSDNMKAVRWLLNEDNWDDLIISSFSTKTNYVVGAPSLEMMMDSYNEHYKTVLTGTSAPDYSAITAGTRRKLWYKFTSRANGYQVGPCNGNSTQYDSYTSDNSVYTDTIDSCYYPGNSKNYWLASPSAYGTNLVVRVRGDNGGFVHYNAYNNISLSFCPLVSLQSDVSLTLGN